MHSWSSNSTFRLFSFCFPNCRREVTGRRLWGSTSSREKNGDGLRWPSLSWKGRKSGQRHSLVHGVSWQPPHPPCYCRVLWTATLRSLTRCPSLPWPLGHVPAWGALRAAWKFQVSTAEVGKQISWWKSSVQVLKLNWNYFEEWESQNPRIKRIQEDIRHGKLSVLSKIFLLVNHTVVQQAWQQTPVIPLKIALMQYFCK